MPQYYVEGLYIKPQTGKMKQKTGMLPAGAVEPYAKSIWANSPQEAIQIATDELQGGEWKEGPKISQRTEEQRMRSLGAPEFPGLATHPAKKQKRHSG